MTKHLAPLLALGALLVVATVLALEPGAETTASAGVSGDTDCDADVDSIDSLFVLRNVAQLGEPAKCIDDGDVNCSDAADSIDALLIQRHIAQLPVNIPKGCAHIGTEAAIVILNEVLFNPAPAEPQSLELLSNDSSGPHLAGLSLVNQDDETYNLPGGLGTKDAGTIVVIFDGQDSVNGPVVHADRTDFLGVASGSVELRRGGETLDRVAWGEDQADGVRLSRGGISEEPETGGSIGRIPGTTDTSRDFWVPFSPKQSSFGEANIRPTVEAALPLDGAVLNDGQFTLSWYPLEGAEAYGLQVSTDDSFAAPQIHVQITEPQFDVDLQQGTYFWRASAVFGFISQGYGPTQEFTVGAPARSASEVQSAAILDVPLIKQKKDTKMLLLESNRETGQHAWDVPHPDLDRTDKADNMNCALASLAMIASFFGGSLSQDRIGYEVFHDRLPGPERDLNYGDGLYNNQVSAAFTFALGVAPVFYLTAGHTPDEIWTFLTTAIDGLKPVLASSGRHAVVVTGYYEAAGQRYLKINDPWVGKYDIRFARSALIKFRALSGEPDVRSDEPSLTSDSDSDGIVDFDETIRFGTSAITADSDRDEYSDKPEVKQSVFWEFGYADFWQLDPSRDWDLDGRPAELDCDNDNDQMMDGADSDDYSNPPVRGSPVPCDIDSAIVTLSWDADNDIDLYVLPMPASSQNAAQLQNQLPGYYQNGSSECTMPASQTNRHVTTEVFALESAYVGVSYWSNCLRPPDGPDGDGPGEADVTVTIQYANGVVEVYLEHVAFFDAWRLFGPLMLPEGPPPGPPQQQP